MIEVHLGNWINSLFRMIFETVVLVLSLYQVLNLYKLDRRIAARKDSITLLTARSGESHETLISYDSNSVITEIGFVYFL